MDTSNSRNVDTLDLNDGEASSKLKKFLGADFPGLPTKAGEDGSAQKGWIKKQYAQNAEVGQIKNLHYNRHDNFRNGRQWLSQRDTRGYREVQGDKNALRPVLNLIGPALDFRLGILMEQRPGWAYQPITTGSAGKEVAEAQQALTEYEFFKSRAWLTFLDAAFWSQTHGAAFIETYVDKSRGPEHENVEMIQEGDERYASLVELGYEQDESGAVIVPLDDSGNFLERGSKVRTLHEGELRHRVVLANEILVDPEARTINGPQEGARWLIKRRARDLAAVRLELGDDKFEGDTQLDGDPNYESLDDMGGRWQRGLPPFPGAKQRRNREAVWEYCVYFAKSDAFEKGAWFRIVGNKVIETSEELPGGVIPFSRFADGSADPQIKPRPVVSDYLPDQISINALLAAQLQAARLGGGRLIAMKNTVIEETYNKIIGGMLEYSGGQKPEVMAGLRASPDLMPTILFLIQQLENKHGWSAIARGQVTGDGNNSSMQDVSGRATLAAKELMERTFGPMVRAMAEGASEWAHVTIQLSKFIMTTDRLIPRVGRPDLAITLSAEKLGDETLVYCDPETMIPLPRSLRNQMLMDYLQKGMITLDQFQARAPYAEVRNLTMGDTPQWERAKWINTLMEERIEDLAAIEDPTQIYSPELGLTILWQDIPGVHKKALAELILNERKPWALRKMAADRWGIYDQLERAQADASGRYPIPWEVIGVPEDKIQMAPPQQMGGGPVQQQAAMPAPQPPTGPAAALPSSPTPEMSSLGGPTAASQDTAEPLGQYGDVEKRADEQQS